MSLIGTTVEAAIGHNDNIGNWVARQVPSKSNCEKSHKVVLWNGKTTLGDEVFNAKNKKC